MTMCKLQYQELLCCYIIYNVYLPLPTTENCNGGISRVKGILYSENVHFNSASTPLLSFVGEC